MKLQFRGLEEDKPGAAWRNVFSTGWPGWREWFLHNACDPRPSIDVSVGAMRRHMPEFERLWEELVHVADADEDATRFLTFWRPPQYLANCSQVVVVDGDGPVLIRNYDLDPTLNEATMFLTGWCGRRTIGMVDGMSGLADGMNDAGLAASLTFGGRFVVGRGFGIPLIIRYLLAMCSDVQEGVEVLRSVPSHMSYCHSCRS